MAKVRFNGTDNIGESPKHPLAGIVVDAPTEFFRAHSGYTCVVLVPIDEFCAAMASAGENDNGGMSAGQWDSWCREQGIVVERDGRLFVEQEANHKTELEPVA